MFDATSAVGDDDDDEALIGEDLDDDEIVALARDNDDDDDDLEDDDLVRSEEVAFKASKVRPGRRSATSTRTRTCATPSTPPSPDEVELEYVGDLDDRGGAESAAQSWSPTPCRTSDLRELDYKDEFTIDAEPPRRR